MSCFGPFKEAPSIPDFIEDQSFEELRYQFLEASKNNQVPNYQMQLSQQYSDANNKLQSLKNMTPEIVNLISNIYNKSGDTKAPVVAAQSSNVFANTSSLVQSNPFQTQQAQIPTNQMSTGNIFGASSSAFGSSTAGNIFGQSQQQQQPSTASIFGSSFSTPAPSGNIFGAPSTNTTASSFSFAQAAPQNSMLGISAPSTNSIFGGSSTNTSNPFAAAPFNQPQQQSFATQQSTFGVAQTQQPSFNSQMSQPFAAPQPQQQQNIFSQSGFASQSTNVFNTQPAMPSNPFMAQPQASLVPQQNTPAQNIFNMPQQNIQSDSGIPSNSIFSIQQPQQQQQQQQLPQQNPFAGSVFSQSQPQQQQQQPSGNFDESNYSKIEDLLPQELEAYQAERFVLGKIPTAPPPRSLC